MWLNIGSLRNFVSPTRTLYWIRKDQTSSQWIGTKLSSSTLRPKTKCTTQHTNWWLRYIRLHLESVHDFFIAGKDQNCLQFTLQGSELQTQFLGPLAKNKTEVWIKVYLVSVQIQFEHSYLLTINFHDSCKQNPLYTFPITTYTLLLLLSSPGHSNQHFHYHSHLYRQGGTN